MDSIISHLQDEISARTAEVMHTGQPGFEPEHSDVRSAVKNMPTVAALSAAAPGDAQFVFYDTLGRRSYSRDGALHLDGDTLKNGEGKSILGFSGDSRATSELHVDAHDIALGRVRQLHIEADGGVCYTRTAIDPKTMQQRSERVRVGTVALARFPAGTQLQAGASGSRAPFGVEPYIGRAGDGNFGMLETGHIDAGRIDINRALARMHDLYSQLEAVTAANQARMATAKTAMDLVK